MVAAPDRGGPVRGDVYGREMRTVRPKRFARTVVVVALVLAASVSAGCGKKPSGPDDRTATVRIDGRTLDFVVDSCGIDGRTVFVVGRPADPTADPGQQIMQAAVGFADRQHQDIDLDAVAVTVDLSATDRVGAIGPESLDRLGGTPPAPGRIESAQRRGSRITIRARAERLTMDNKGTGESAGPLVVDTRCADPDA